MFGSWKKNLDSLYVVAPENRGDGDDDEHHRATVDLSVAVRGQFWRWWWRVQWRRMSGDWVYSSTVDGVHHKDLVTWENQA